MKIKTATSCLLTLFLLIAGTTSLFGQQKLTKVGVVDLTRVFIAYYKDDTQSIKDLYKFWTETQTDLEKMAKEISALEEKLEKAKEENNGKAALDYEKTINEKKEYQRQFYQVRKQEYERKFEAVATSSALYNEILKVIEYIAVKDSYTLILKYPDPLIIYYSKDIDITEDVLDYLQK